MEGENHFSFRTPSFPHKNRSSSTQDAIANLPLFLRCMATRPGNIGSETRKIFFRAIHLGETLANLTEQLVRDPQIKNFDVFRWKLFYVREDVTFDTTTRESKYSRSGYLCKAFSRVCLIASSRRPLDSDTGQALTRANSSL